jgi:hypothetical protein
MVRVTADLVMDRGLVYAIIQGRTYALGPDDSFEMDHPRLYRKLVVGKGR